jgi:lipoate-protein ligase A
MTKSPVDTTQRLFASLEIYNDIDSRTAGLNMAIDEALLEGAIQPTIRFYRWDHPALSFGYFGRFADVENHESQRDIVRRWTGGGIVFHREDVTYSIVIPASDSAFAESSMSIYEKTHAAIRAALAASGKKTELADVAAPKISESCFANAVRADVLWNGQKVAGAAQRRTRRGLLQQGSIQNVDLAPNFAKHFAAQLSASCRKRTIGAALVQRAQQIAEEKYATVAWLRRRR